MTTILLTLGAIAAIALIAWVRHRTARVRVLAALERVRARDVKLTVEWFDLDRDTMTYDVEYTTPTGARHRNRCKVAMHMGSDEGVYWARGLEGASDHPA